MRRLPALPLVRPLCTLALLCGFVSAHAADYTEVERIVLLRHGEKPPAGLGQLNCQGLNRALALPAVLTGKFGKADAIFAPNPSKQKPDQGTLYDYIRPLATIEPTAIQLGLPVNTDIGFDETDRLASALLQPRYRKALIFVAWEHTEAATLAGRLLGQFGGDPHSVPKWKGNDFDSLYVVELRRQGDKTTAQLHVEKQGLDGLSTSCPK
jgi:hypothetical protein